MGYSCSHLASCRYQSILDACFSQTGVQNVYEKNRKKYFIEVGEEQRDGAITGYIMKMSDDGLCKRSGSFRIEPNGKILRGPKFMKTIPLLLVKIDKFEERYQGQFPVSDDILRDYIFKWVKQWEVGGVNHKAALSMGRIPYPSSASIVDEDGVVLASWKAGMFQVW